ncbi:MAG TPA: Mut7-C RNAse domain-containing protein [Burkholderiaceae bacterium]|nr:Mut7-C RNAse domain-containing protein [Burkholderiaceae bacterium]
MASSARPFTRCLSCNAPLRPLASELAAPRVPPRVRALHDRFVTCDGCGRVFWEGSHWRRMRTLLDALLHGGGARASAPASACSSPPAPS